jgi:hypothetical protein
MSTSGTLHPVGTSHRIIPSSPGESDLHGEDYGIMQTRLAQLYREIDIFQAECAALLQALQAVLRYIECEDRPTDAWSPRLSVCGIAVHAPDFAADVRHAQTVIIDECAACAVRTRRLAERAGRIAQT